MKYYYNEQTKALLVDENDYTSYLTDRGYIEVTKEFYDEKEKELIEKFLKEKESEQEEQTVEA